MNKYTNALYPDKINDLVDNEGNVNFEQQPWSPLKIHYTFQEIVDNYDDGDLHSKLESEITGIDWSHNLDGIMTAVNYIEFSTADDFVFKGLIGCKGSVTEESTFSGLAFNGEKTIVLEWFYYPDPETGDLFFKLGDITILEDE